MSNSDGQTGGLLFVLLYLYLRTFFWVLGRYKPPHLRQKLSEVPEGSPVEHYAKPPPPPPNAVEYSGSPNNFDGCGGGGMRKSQSFAGVQNPQQQQVIDWFID